jgi:hypothetical protein
MLDNRANISPADRPLAAAARASSSSKLICMQAT